MAIPDFDYFLEFDANRDGTFELDETGRLLHAEIRRGSSDALTPKEPGQLTLTMQNRDGRYSPDKGVISGLDQLIPVRLWVKLNNNNGTNLIENPSAEKSATGSTAVGSASAVRSAGASWVGEYAYSVTTANLDESGVALHKFDGTRMAVTAGLAYTFAPRVKGTSAKSLLLQIVWYNSGAGVIQTDEGGFTTSTDWIQPSLIGITAPVGAVTALVRVVTDGAQGAFVFYVDAAFFYQGSTLLLYIDGDQPLCAWLGTAHQSQSRRSTLEQSHLMFEGLLANIAVKEETLDQTATLTVLDRAAFFGQTDISLGNLLAKPIQLVIHRILDKLEGELIANPGFEGSHLTNPPPPKRRAGRT